MNGRRVHGQLSGALLIAMIAGQASGGEERIEISDDGRVVVTGDPFPAESGGTVTLGAGIPFPTAPDLTLELRRQVGGIKVADMNGDGRNDIVVGCYISSSFPPYDDWHDFILYNDYENEPSDLGAWPMWVSDNETHTGDVQVGEVNGLPGLELVTIHGGSLTPNSVRVFAGSASGPETSASYVCSTPQNVWGTSGLLVDLDNDGDMDLVTSNQGLSPSPFRPMYQFENEGGALTVAPVWQSSEQSIQGGLSAGDLDEDGFLDIGVSKWVNFESGVYWNNAGTLDVNQGLFIGNTEDERGTVFADFDNDGTLDLAVGGGPTRWYAYDGASLLGQWAANPPFQSTPQDMVSHDVDGDGDPDLAEIIFSDGRAHIYQNNGGVLDTDPTWTFDASEVGTAIAFGDINGDGLDDLVTGYAGNTCVRVFLAQPASGCLADLAPPFGGVLDFSDVTAFLSGFAAMDPAVDFAPPAGVFDFSDVVTFLGVFGSGCP